MKYGVQMYSVRDLTGTDMNAALKAVAEIGYSYVEFAGFSGKTAEEIKAMLDNYGLVCNSTHTGWESVANDFAGTVKYHHTIGNKNIIVPGADLGNQEKLDRFIKFANEYGPKLAAEGITLGYHNHSHEFYANADGSMIHQQLEDKTDIRFQIDTYWAFNAKLDPIALLERLKNRISIIHLKDGDENGHGFSLGSGKAPVAAVREKAIELGFMMVVESETCQPTGVEEVTRCMDYLRELDKDGK